MPIAYLLVAFLTGTAAASGWVFSGGTLPSAFVVYMMTGVIFIATLMPMVAGRAQR